MKTDLKVAIQSIAASRIRAGLTLALAIGVTTRLSSASCTASWPL